MSPYELLPSALPFGVHPGIYRCLLLGFFILHILFMNIMTGLVFLSAALRFTRHKNALAPVWHMAGRHLPVITALAVNLGVAALLFLQARYGQFFYVSSQLTAGFWMLVIPLLMVAYGGFYLIRFRPQEKTAGRLSMTALLLPPIFFAFTNNMTLMLSPETWGHYFTSPSGWIIQWRDPMLVPRLCHFLLASVAMGGLYLAGYWHFRRGAPDEPRHHDSLSLCPPSENLPGPRDAAVYIRLGLRWFTGATICQVLVGAWFFLSLPFSVIRLFSGGDAVHTLFFLLALVLAAQSIRFALAERIAPAVISAVLTVAAMCVMRDLVREAILHPAEGAITTTGDQYGALALFLFAFLGAGLGVYKALTLSLKSGRAAFSPAAVSAGFPARSGNPAGYCDNEDD